MVNLMHWMSHGRWTAISWWVFHRGGYFCDFVVMFFVDVASFCLPMSIQFRVSSKLFERAEVTVLLVLVRYDIKLDVRDDGKLLPLILLSYGFDFPLKLKFPLFDREWLKIILADRGLLYLMWSCYWAESKGFIGSTIVLTMLLVYVWSIGRVFISRDVWWNSSLIFRQHSVFEAQVYYEFLWTLRALSERFK